jgi:hypothetical protein
MFLGTETNQHLDIARADEQTGRRAVTESVAAVGDRPTRRL